MCPGRTPRLLGIYSTQIRSRVHVTVSIWYWQYDHSFFFLFTKATSANVILIASSVISGFRHLLSSVLNCL